MQSARVGTFRTDAEGRFGRSFTENSRGEWVPSIPLPYYGFICKKCSCGAKFWTEEGYRGHYGLRHILDPD